jgi:acyl carrier protein
MNIDDEVKRVIGKILKIPPDQLTDDRRLDELGADSIHVVEIVFTLEEAFGIDIGGEADPMISFEEPVPSSESSRLATVGDIRRALQDAVNAKAGK